MENALSLSNETINLIIMSLGSLAVAVPLNLDPPLGSCHASTSPDGHIDDVTGTICSNITLRPEGM